MEYLIGFTLGFIASVVKDLLQQYIFVRNHSRMHSSQSDELLAQIMSEGFPLNKEEDKDSSNIERNYKSYYS